MLLHGWGRATAADYVGSWEAFATVVKGEPDGWRLIADYRGVEGLDPSLTPDMVRAVGLRNAQLLDGADFRSVWITRSPLLLGMVRMHNGFSARSAEEVAHVESMSEALAALGLPSDILPAWADTD